MVQRYPKRTLFVSIGLATALHLGLFFVPLLPSIPVSRIERAPIMVTLVPQTVEPPAEAVAKAAANVVDGGNVESMADQEIEQNPPVRLGIPSPVEPELVTIGKASSDTQKKGKKKNRPAKRLATLLRAMVRSYIAQEIAKDLGQTAQSCDLAQRASEIRHCDEDDEELWRDIRNQRYEETFDVAFAPLFVRDQFRDSMVLVDRLMKRQELLNEIVRLEGFVSDDIAAMLREIREDFNYMDSQSAASQFLTICGRTGDEMRVCNVWEWASINAGLEK